MLNVAAAPEAVREIAKRSRGTPRIANRLLRRVRDFAQVLNDGVISLDVAQTALDRLRVDSLGLDDVDIRYLRGLSNVSAAVRSVWKRWLPVSLRNR